jgi:hypothetical protein
MMEAVQTSETSVDSYRSTRRYNREDSHLDVDEVLQSLQSYTQFCKKIHSEEKVVSLTFTEGITKLDAYRPNYGHVTPDVRSERSLSCALPASRKRFTRRDTVDLSGTEER